jgi:hypothetical protein
VGYCHHKPSACRCRRPRPRTCLRKGCGRQYTPRRWNQRYCQDTECMRLVRRWHAARRQAERREEDAVKAQHAEAERARRGRVKSLPQAPNDPEVTAARGHAAKNFSPTPICERPGCHDTPPKSGRNQAKYCCLSCRQAIYRVLDRERKWLKRGDFQGRRAREREYQAARVRRRGEPHNSANETPARPPPA